MTKPQHRPETFRAYSRTPTGVELRMLRQHLTSLDRLHCGEERPCWTDLDQPVPCLCSQRTRRWRAFWLLVKHDMEGDFPQPLLPRGEIGPWITYHQPIFTFVCPVCRHREDSYRMGMYGYPLGSPALHGDPPTWLRLSFVLTPEERQIHRFSVMTIEVCSDACAEKFNAHRKALDTPD